MHKLGQDVGPEAPAGHLGQLIGPVCGEASLRFARGQPAQARAEVAQQQPQRLTDVGLALGIAARPLHLGQVVELGVTHAFSL